MSECTSTEVPAFDDLMRLMQLFAEPARLQAAMDGYAAAAAKAREAERDAERAVAALKARETELTKRSAALDARETALQVIEKRWQQRQMLQDARERLLSNDGQRRWLLEQIEHAKGNDERTRRHVMRLAHIDSQFNSELQTLPDWDSLINVVLGDAPDPHFGGRAIAEGEPDPSMTPMPAAVTLIREPSRRGA